MKNIIISIIIPAYNISHYIGVCLDSVIQQTWRDLEIIVVDDGSTDHTAQVVEFYAEKDQRIRLIRKKNEGVTSARLTGIRQATGEYIGFVDGDDVIEPNMYERLLINAVNYQADISHCGYQMVFPNRVDYYYNTGSLMKQERAEALKELLSGKRIEPGLWNKLFHKSLFHNLLCDDIMDVTIRNYEDLLMNYYLFKESKYSVFEDWCPYHYVVRKGSAATSKINEHKLLDPIKVVEILMKETEKDEELQSILFQRLLRLQIGLATMPEKESGDVILPYKRKAKLFVKNKLFECLRTQGIDVKLKVIIFWVSIWPWSYEKVHIAYNRITGNDKKYDVD